MTHSYRLLIGDALREGAATFDVVNPATGETFALAPRADLALLEEAVAAAKRAAPGWAATPIERRADAVLAIADALDGRVDEFARLLTEEQGKPLDQARSEISRSAQTLRIFAGMRPERRTLRQNGRSVVVEHRSPLGVVAAIMPWNFPMRC